MLELATFGGVTVLRDGVVIPWSLRGGQRAALLALLAGAGKRGIDRLALAAALWPDSPEGAARHSLDELLSRTRRELDEPELFVGSTNVALNVAVITTDVLEFEAAVAASRLDAAAQCYRGPFADGLRTADSTGLDSRITALRTRFAARFRQVAETLAGDATRRGDFSAAARWWERVVTADPESTTAVHAYVEALAASGDRGRALSVARARLKHDELEGRGTDAAKNVTLRWYYTGIVFYFITCFQCALQTTLTFQQVIHFTDWVVAHAHFVMFGVFSFWIFGTMTYLFPRLLGRAWYSDMLCECHYWFSTLGLLIMFIDLTIVGVLQGFSWASMQPWDRSVQMSIPFWWLRIFMGLGITIGQVCFFINIYKTYRLPVPAEEMTPVAATP